MSSNRFASLFSAAVLAISALLPAQTVTMRGEVVDGRATGCYYCPGSQYAIKWVGTRLDGSQVNLAPFLDQQCELTGNWNGNLTTPVVTVTSIRLLPDTFSITGNTRIGNRVRYNTAAIAGDLVANVLGFNRSFFPMLPLVFSLDPASAFVLGSGPAGGNGEFKSDLDIPNDTALVGLRIYGQGLVLPTLGVPYWTNPDTKVITL